MPREIAAFPGESVQAIVEDNGSYLIDAHRSGFF